MNDDLGLAARGIRWNYLGSGATLAAQVLYTALTARLVSPAGFGAYAAAQALAALVGYFGPAVLGSALIRHEREGRRVVGTAMVISIVAGTITSLAILFAAGPWGRLWDIPESESVGRLFALVMICSAVGFVPLALLRKAFEYRRAALIESLSQIAGMAGGGVLALELRSPTALVIGQAIGAGLTAAAAIIASRKKLRLAFSGREARSLLSFSAHVSGQSLVYYGLYTVPSLVFSRLYGAAALGGYSRANLIVTLPTTHLWMGVTKTLYPLIARARDDAQRLRRLIETTVLSTTGVSWPLFAAVAGASPLVVRVLLGPDWPDVASLLPPILVFGAVNLAYVVAGNPLEVLAYQRVIWRFQFLWVCLLATALGTAVLWQASPPAVLWLVAGAQVVVHIAKLRRTAQLGLVRFASILKGYAATLVLSAVFFAVARTAERATTGVDLLLTRVVIEALAILIAIAATAVLLPSTPFGRGVRGGLNVLRQRLPASLRSQPASQAAADREKP